MVCSGPVPAGRAVVFIALAAVAWGTGGAVAAVLFSTSGLDAFAVSFWRFAGGTAVLAAAWPLVRPARGPSLADRLRAIPVRPAANGVGMAVFQTAYFAAVDRAGVAVATVVTLGAGPVFVALGARLWLGERLTRGRVGVTCLAIAGLVLLSMAGAEAGTASGRWLPGIALALLSALGYAGTILLGRSLGAGRDGEPLGDTLIGLAVGTAFLLPAAAFPVSVAAGGLLPQRGDAAVTVALLAYLGLVPSALAYALFFAGLRAVTAGTASVLALIEPLTAAAVAVFLLGERLTPAGLAGGVILLAAVALLAVGEHRSASG